MKVPKNFPDRTVCIVGLGYVGTTLAVTMAEVGFEVYCVERDPKIVEAVRTGRAHFVEAGLAPRLAAQVAAGRIKAGLDWPEAGQARVYIIAIGTPLAAGQSTNLDAIRLASGQVAAVLREGDLVILRSTVRIGVSREIVKPILDKVGIPYSLAFCPERTLEGKALIELRTLPQIIGGLDEQAAIRTSQMFNFMTPTTIRVRDLETAEMIKLINNSQRDLNFAFANEVADMCDAIGVSAVEVIRASNIGYSRGSMPMPGPVGGPCLEKDPYILADGVRARGGRARLALLARSINEEMPEQTVARVDAALGSSTITKVVIAGLAFKGRPETSDLRGTLAIPLIASLKRRYPSARIVGYDPAVSRDDVLALGITYAETAAEAFEGANCVIFQNNNVHFELLDLGSLAAGMQPGGVIYDLWNQFEVETLNLGGRVQYFGFGTRVLLNGGSRSI